MTQLAKENERWLLLAGHDIGEGGNQTVKTSMLEDLMDYINKNSEDIWLATVAEVTQYVKAQRRATPESL